MVAAVVMLYFRVRFFTTGSQPVNSASSSHAEEERQRERDRWRLQETGRAEGCGEKKEGQVSHRNRYRGWYSSESKPHVESDDWRPEVCEVQSAAGVCCWGGGGRRGFCEK